MRRGPRPQVNYSISTTQKSPLALSKDSDCFRGTRSGLQDFRFHDFRTKVQRAGHNQAHTACHEPRRPRLDLRYIAWVDEEVPTYVEDTQAAQSDP